MSTRRHQHLLPTLLLWGSLLLWLPGLRLTGSTNEIVDIRRDYHVQQWTTEHGLPDDRILSLVQTRDGYLWIGTMNGLLRFDGVRFTTFNRANTPALLVNEIQCLLEDQEGVLWINGQKTHIATLQAGEFREATTREGEPIRGVLCSPSPRGGVWVSLESGPTLTRWEHGKPQEQWPLEIGINVGVAEVKDSALWVANPGSLRRRLAGSWRDFERPRPINVFETVSIFAKGPQDAWYFLGDGEKPSHIYRLTSNGPVLFTDQLPPNVERSRFLVAARDDSLWLPYHDQGLLNLRGTNYVRYALPWGRPSDFPLCAMEDREGNLWVGSEYSGLFRLRHKAARVIGAAEGLPHENVRCVLADGHGQVWTGTDDGLAVLTGARDRDPLQLPQVRVMPRLPLSEFSVRTIAGAASDGAWVGTSRGVFRLKDEQYQPQAVPVLNHYLDQEKLASSKLRSLLLGDSGHLWSASPVVLSVMQPRETIPRPVSVFNFNRGHNTLLEDRGGNVWVATDGAGVAIFPCESIAEFLARPPPFTSTNLAYHDFTFHPTGFSLPDTRWLTATNGLPSNHTWELYEASDGAMWIATEGGVARVPPDSAFHTPLSAFTFTTAHGLPDHLVNSFIEDDHGHLWFGTDTGIYHVRQDELLAIVERRANRVHATTYSEVDGLISTETNGRISHPGVCKTPDGRLWFATTKGVAVFDPQQLHAAEETPPLVAVEEVLADGELIFAHTNSGANRGIAHASLPATRKPLLRHLFGSDSKRASSLPPGRGRVIEFHFTGLSFAAPDKCRFQYRLDGYDEPGAWHDAGVLRLARYTNLDPGKYRFEVLVRNHRNVLAKAPAIFAFSVAPFLSQTWWFWTLMSLGGGGVLASIVSWRLRWARQISALQSHNALLQQRADIARDLHDDLGPRLTQLALLTELAESRVQGMEDTAATRQQLAGIARDLSIRLEGTLGALEPEADTLSSFADVLGDFAHEFLRPTGVPLHLERSDEIPSHPLARTTKHQTFRIVNEALNNLVKHASATHVTLRMHCDSGCFIIEIADNGRGFEDARILDSASSLSVSHSGLRNMRSRAEAIRASVEIESRPEHGTTVRLSIPLNGKRG